MSKKDDSEDDVLFYIGPYAVIRKLAGTGFADVLLARHPRLNNRIVCIKRPHRNSIDDEQLLNMFFAETRIAAELVHPNIVQVIDAGQDEDERPYMVMEHVHGVDARQLLRQMRPRALPAADVAFILAEIAHALAFAHDRAVIHRDVNPSSILISHLGEAKLTDFAIARIQRAGAYTTTHTTAYVGRTGYMAPELLAILEHESVGFDHTADLWSLGVTGWELLCGSRPFADRSLGAPTEGRRLDAWELHNVLRNRRRSIHEAAPDAPRALRDLIERLIQPLDERITSAQDVIEWLARAELGLPTHRGTFARLVQATAGPKETLTWEPFDLQDPEDPDDPEQAA
jgi:serine/threonine protein kinase